MAEVGPKRATDPRNTRYPDETQAPQRPAQTAAPTSPGVTVSDEVKRVFSFSLRPALTAKTTFAIATTELEAAKQALADAQPAKGKGTWRPPDAALQAARSRLDGAQQRFDDARAALGESREDLKRLAIAECAGTDPTLRTLTGRIDAAGNASSWAQKASAMLHLIAPALEADKPLGEGDAETLRSFQLAVDLLNASLKKLSPTFAQVGDLGLEDESPGGKGTITPAVMKKTLEATKAYVDGTRAGDLTLRDARATEIASYLEATVAPQPAGHEKKK